MNCSRCHNGGAIRKKNGYDAAGQQKWRVTCHECRRVQQRQYRGKMAIESDKMLFVQMTIDAALGRPW